MRVLTLAKSAIISLVTTFEHPDDPGCELKLGITLDLLVAEYLLVITNLILFVTQLVALCCSHQEYVWLRKQEQTDLSFSCLTESHRGLL